MSVATTKKNRSEQYRQAVRRTRILSGGETKIPVVDIRELPLWCSEMSEGNTKVFVYNQEPVETSYSRKHAGENRAQLAAAQASTVRELLEEKISQEEIDELLRPTEIHRGNLFVPMSDGRTAKLPFFRVLFGKDGQGGVRMHEAVTLDEVKALAFTMGKKHAITGQSRSGAKGGIGAGILLGADGAPVLEGGQPVELNLETFSTPELQFLIGYHFRSVFGLNWGRDGAAPDVQTGPDFVKGFVKRHEELTGHSAPWVATGKAVQEGNPNGGSKFRTQATGEGVIFINHLALRELGIPVAGSTVAVQGTGNVGWHAVMAATRSGQRVQYVSDLHGALYFPSGLAVEVLASLGAYLKQNRTVRGFEAPGVEAFDKEKILEVAVDTLIPAALGGVIDDAMAEKIQAKVVIEAANTPVVGAGRQILARRGIMSVPDLLANAAGTVDSVVGEQEQNISGVVLDAETEQQIVNDKLEAAFTKAMAYLKAAGSMDRAVERAAGLELYRRSKRRLTLV